MTLAFIFLELVKLSDSKLIADSNQAKNFGAIKIMFVQNTLRLLQKMSRTSSFHTSTKGRIAHF